MLAAAAAAALASQGRCLAGLNAQQMLPCAVRWLCAADQAASSWQQAARSGSSSAVGSSGSSGSSSTNDDVSSSSVLFERRPRRRQQLDKQQQQQHCLVSEWKCTSLGASSSSSGGGGGDSGDPAPFHQRRRGWRDATGWLATAHTSCSALARQPQWQQQQQQQHWQQQLRGLSTSASAASHQALSADAAPAFAAGGPMAAAAAAAPQEAAAPARHHYAPSPPQQPAAVRAAAAAASAPAQQPPPLPPPPPSAGAVQQQHPQQQQLQQQLQQPQQPQQPQQQPVVLLPIYACHLGGEVDFHAFCADHNFRDRVTVVRDHALLEVTERAEDAPVLLGPAAAAAAGPGPAAPEAWGDAGAGAGAGAGGGDGGQGGSSGPQRAMMVIYRYGSVIFFNMRARARDEWLAALRPYVRVSSPAASVGGQGGSFAGGDGGSSSAFPGGGTSRAGYYGAPGGGAGAGAGTGAAGAPSPPPLAPLSPSQGGALRQDETLVVVRPDLAAWSALEPDRIVVRALDVGNVRVISHVLGQSVALDYCNSKVDDAIRQFAPYLAEVAATGQCGHVKEARLLQLIADNSLLYTDVVTRIGLLDISQTAWTQDRYHDLWQALRADYELDRRFDAINRKLGPMLENAKFLLDVRAERRSVEAEYAIIALIMLEVLLNAAHHFAPLGGGG